MRETEKIWADGVLINSEQATMHVLSHATQRGSAVFDVIKLVHLGDEGDLNPHAVGLDGHIDRFRSSMDLMGMESDYSSAALKEAVAETVAANPGATVVKLVAAWSEIPLRTLPLTTTPNVWVAALLPDAGADRPSVAGVRLQTATAPKMPASILPPNLKVAASYTAGVRQRMAAVAAGFDDVVSRTVEGHLAEGTTQSLAVVCAGPDQQPTLLLPPLDTVLDSITRQMMLDVAKAEGIAIQVRTVQWPEVLEAQELYLSSANASVIPVAAIDDTSFEAPGPVTTKLADAAAALEAGTHPCSARWLTAL